MIFAFARVILVDLHCEVFERRKLQQDTHDLHRENWLLSFDLHSAAL
jgi:hypothetical protein